MRPGVQIPSTCIKRGEPGTHTHTYTQRQSCAGQRQEDLWGLMAARLALGCARGLVSTVESDRAEHTSSPGLCVCLSVHAIPHPIAHAHTHVEDYNRAIDTRVLWSLVAMQCHGLALNYSGTPLCWRVLCCQLYAS